MAVTTELDADAAADEAAESDETDEAIAEGAESLEDAAEELTSCEVTTEDTALAVAEDEATDETTETPSEESVRCKTSSDKRRRTSRGAHYRCKSAGLFLSEQLLSIVSNNRCQSNNACLHHLT